MQLKYNFASLLSLCFLLGHSQPKKLSSSEIYQEILKLNTVASVLYIAAHPDDENTRLISYMANHRHVRTGYLSLTRGDGGQNLIGPELRELLGVIRTQELLEARKIDGGDQFFTRANDFGYSKFPDETLRIWNKDEVLHDVVWAIRKFQPDIIVNRFDSRTSGTTHGHHTASAMLSIQAAEMASDPKVFPQQLQSAGTWKPERIFFNTSHWFYGGKEKFDKADKSKLYQINTGEYFATLGLSNQEIAALSRSKHQSQGFGTSGTRGDEAEYLEQINGGVPPDRRDVFSGINTSWSRLKGGKAIGELISKIAADFNFSDPAKSIPQLLKALQMVNTLEDEHWKQIKKKEITEIIAACSGLYLEASADSSDSTPGSKVQIAIEAINRSQSPMTLQSVKIEPGNILISKSDMPSNQAIYLNAEIKIPEDFAYTQPYWLESPPKEGMYVVEDPAIIGTPDIIRKVKATFNVQFGDVIIPYEREVIYKYNDDVKGEIYEPFDVVPDVTTLIEEKVMIFPGSQPREVAVRIIAGKAAVSGTCKLKVSGGWLISPEAVPFSLSNKGEEKIVRFIVTPPSQPGETELTCIASSNGKNFDRERIDINYPHISQQLILKPSAAKLIKLNIKTGSEKIAYIMGAGDQVPQSLQQMGYSVTIVKPEEITPAKMASFDVAVMGIRAYNTVKELRLRQTFLFDFVKAGKTMIVQYNTSHDLVTDLISPFPLKLSRDRVTDENAEVRFLAPEHRILNFPNKITSADFKGWTQEQGLYYPSEWDNAFTPLISSNDPGENPKNGGLLVARYGKGHYIYTGLSFFRELPEGVPGAFRLMANLISAGK